MAGRELTTHIQEPHRGRFIGLLERGAAGADIFGKGSSAVEAPGAKLNESFVCRELDRVQMHSRGFVALLAAHGVTCKRVLDVGCSTGGSTAAIALSEALHPAEVIGIDPNALSIEAAKVRAEGLGIAGRVRFETIVAGQPLPFADSEFDLVVAVSVLEFIPSVQVRQQFLADLERITSPGGFIYVATPSILRLRELHSQRWFGNFRRSETAPWASPGWFVRRSLLRCKRIRTKSWQVRLVLDRVKLPGITVLTSLIGASVLAFAPWQKHLYRKQ